jgi:signal transduction histidine kinase
MRWRILFWMLLVALGPLVIMAAQGYHCARQGIIASEEAHLHSVLQSREARLQAWIDQVHSDFRFLTVSPCVRGLCGMSADAPDAASCAEACNLFDDLRRGSPFYNDLVTYDSAWRPIVHSMAGACLLDHGDPGVAGGQSGAAHALAAEPATILPALHESLRTATGLVLSAPHLHIDAGLVMHVGQRVSHSNVGGPAYIVASLTASQRIDPILADRTGLGETGKAYLRLAQGSYLSAGEMLCAPSPVGPAAQAEGTQHAVDRYRDHRGVPVLGVAAALPALACTLVVEMDESEAFAWLTVLRDRAIVTGLITLLLVVLIAWRGARSLAQPLRELASVARRIASGHTEDRVGRLTGAEADEVGRAFNRMIDELDASQKRLAQAASLAAVGELSSRIVHEMRNPLSSIKLNLQALERKVAGDSAYAELAAIASSQVARLEKMLTELLGYGKPLQLSPREVRFAEIAGEVADLCRPEALEREVHLEVADQTGEARFLADPEQLRRALTNLVANAVQASPPGGQVVLAADVSEDEPGRVCITVADEGSGIAAPAKEHLFRPFFTTREEGTGLGLANVKKIAECHGGAVFARNRAEGGALFGILLPLGGMRT